MLIIFAVLVAVTTISFVIAWRTDSSLRNLLKRLHSDHEKLVELDQRFEKLKNSFMKVLTPIRQNSEDIIMLDDDLARVQKLIDELKTREEDPPPTLTGS